METPICVIDARTFVDHIQNIKHWIYSGHLRLVVPSCTIEQVEQLYQKSVEPKQKIQEAPRSRTSGKPPKKEYPTFDINPRVAREYLGRLKTRKEQDADSEQRVFFQEKENHGAVHFQQPIEQYTPWKDLDVEEEKSEVIEGPPTSWAEALRRKQNLANGISEKSVSKAPTKPKLVARAAGSETSPWKVKKDAPKISAKDVPAALRPLLSCALWHLHESIERNDANQLFLLSDQTETRSIAQKLNIIAHLPQEIAATVASKTSRSGLDTFGDLEQEFGFQQKSTTLAIGHAEEVIVENGVLAEAHENLFKEEDGLNNSISSVGTVNTDASSIVHEQDLGKLSSERQGKESSVDGDHGEEKIKAHNIMDKTTATLAEALSEAPAKRVESTTSLAGSIMQQGPEKRLSESINDLKINGVSDQSDLAHQPAIGKSTILSQPETLLPQPQKVEPSQHVQEEAANGTHVSQTSIDHSTPTVEAAQEPDDSDEEVVVFIPQTKRLSTQHKPAQQGSRPSTPKEQPQQKPAGQSPSKSSVKPQPKGKAAKHSPNPSLIGQTLPQTVNAPTVIDPDAFGRDFRVNLNPSPRAPHHPNSHSNHRARGNGHNSQAGQVPRSLPRQLARTSPPRNNAQDKSRRLPSRPGPAPKDAPNHRRQASRTSPQPALAPKAQEQMFTDVESVAPTPAVLSNSEHPESRIVEPTKFVPQTAISTEQLESKEFQSGISQSTDYSSKSTLPNAHLISDATEPRVYDASEFVPRPPRPVRDFKPRAPRPKVIEAAEFVPRDFVPRATGPRTQPKQYLPEPESIEPRPSNNDVDYVLKSGSTRASARGRGRLWTPS